MKGLSCHHRTSQVGGSWGRGVQARQLAFCVPCPWPLDVHARGFLCYSHLERSLRLVCEFREPSCLLITGLRRGSGPRRTSEGGETGGCVYGPNYCLAALPVLLTLSLPLVGFLETRTPCSVLWHHVGICVYETKASVNLKISLLPNFGDAALKVLSRLRFSMK